MADKKSLGFFGFVLGLVTGAVMLAAAVTVQAQIAAGPDAQANVVSALPPR
jgi:hypothetical protein